jgi:radical SAM superfamily enzyme YgiQ (UPF0313 family)
MKKRIIICKPNTKDLQYGKLKSISAIEPPIWHAVLSTTYKATGIVDAEADNLSEEDTIKAIMAYDPDKIILLATGSHPSAFIQQKDAIASLGKLLEPYNRQVVLLNKLPINPIYENPNWSLLPLEKYRCHNWHSWTNNSKTQPYGVTYTSISCPFHCSFCVIHQFYGEKYEERTVANICRDLRHFKKRKIKNIKFMDELFIFNKQRVHEICDEIIKLEYDFNIWAYARIDIMDVDLLQKLRKAGIKWLAYGIEAGNDKVRQEALKGHFTKDRIRDVIKMTKEADICIIGNYMFGFWDDTIETMQETLDLALELNTEYVNFYCVTAYPDTPLYTQLQELGVDLPTECNQYAQTSETFKPLPTKTVLSSDVLKFRDAAFRTYFSSSSYLSMIRQKFGLNVIEEINNMINIPMKRTT